MKKAVIATAVVAVLAAGFWVNQGSAKGNIGTEYRTVLVESGNINKRVSATGTLAAVDDVVVGAQLSGQITAVLVDFNDSVEQGQLLAQIDPSTFRSQLAQAQADLQYTDASITLQRLTIEQAQIDLAKAERDLTRAKGLNAEKLLSDDELDTLTTSYETQQITLAYARAELTAQQATRASKEASVEQAQIQLDRTEIRSPITGFVIDRTIETGQTVASSYSTPELFTLARDLSQMQIEAYIDESDIGQIALDQNVDFTVDAFPEQRFRGKVIQIQRAPQSNSGVISYTVIISTDNPKTQLLPGMTANLEVEIDTLRNIQRVPNSALRIAERLASQQTTAQGPMAQLQQLGLTREQQEKLQAVMPKSNASQNLGPPGSGDSSS
ncbi:MAG: efflux RND transporter periplasmic adaptor subunit, partial [Ferrimonas sp.]